MSVVAAVTHSGSRTASSPRRRARHRLAIERRQGLVWSGPGRLRLSIHSALFRRADRHRCLQRYRGGSITGTSSFPGFTGRERESSTWAVGGRAGVLVTPRFLTYFDGGFTQARFDGVNYNFNPGGGPSGVSLAAQTYNGWFIGTGFEYAFTWLPINGLFLKTEFRYSQYGGDGVSVPLTGGGVPGSGAKLPEGDGVRLHRTGLALQLVWALIGLRGRGAEPGTKVPGFFASSCLHRPGQSGNLNVGRSVLGFDALVFPIRQFTVRTVGDRSAMILVSCYRDPSGDNSPKLGSVASDATFNPRFY